MAETFGQRFDQHTDDIITATELLKELADRVGKYVWKKYGGEMLLVNPTMYVTGMFDDVTVTADFDISNLDISFFDGFKDTVGNYFSYENGSLYFIFVSNGNKALVTSWNASTGKMVINASANFGTNAPIVYNGVKADYVDYVVSDDPTAYPDGGMQDGYWYERVVEGTKYGAFFNAINKNGYPTDLLIKATSIAQGMFGINSNANMGRDILKAEVIADSILDNGLRYLFQYITGSPKIKIKCKFMGKWAVHSIGTANSASAKVWIGKECETIDGTVAGNGIFASGSMTTKAYCEVASKPSGWSPYWNYMGNSAQATITWGVTEEQFDAL